MPIFANDGTGWRITSLSKTTKDGESWSEVAKRAWETRGRKEQDDTRQRDYADDGTSWAEHEAIHQKGGSMPGGNRRTWEHVLDDKGVRTEKRHDTIADHEDGPMVRPVATLTAALQSAKTAHTEWEKKHGKDKDWQGWYAKHVSDQTGIRVGRLKSLITEAATIHTGDDWPERYAEYIAKRIRS